MNPKLPLFLLLSSSFACRNASVKLDENDGTVTEDSGIVDTDTEDTGDIEDTGDVQDTGIVVDTADTDPVDTGDTNPVDTGDTNPIDTGDTGPVDTGDTSDTGTVDTGDTNVDPNDVDDDVDGYTENDGDCDDADPLVNPGAQEIANDGIDNDCVGGDEVNDADGDGIPTDDDCDDSDPNIGALQEWYLDIDQDGFGSTIIPPVTSCTQQVDGNGNPYSSNALDCNDTSASIYPGAPEVWYDGIDQDCNPATEFDQDNDGYNIDALDCDGDGTTELSCDLNGDGVDDFIGGGDCNDTDATSIPTDVDGDGVSVCAGDCDDNNNTVHPGATEIYWDFLDNDCDGSPDFINRNTFTGRLEGDGNSDAFGFDNSISLTDIDGDGLLDVAIGGSFISSPSAGGVFFANNTSRTWDSSATWDDAMSSFSDKEIAGHDYNWLSNMPRTFGDNNADGTIDIAVTGSDPYNDFGDSIAGALYFDYANIGNNEDIGDNADITFVNSMSAMSGTRIYNQFDWNGDGYDDVIFSDFIGARVSQFTQYFRTWPGGGQFSCSTTSDCGDSALVIYDGININNGTWNGELDLQSDYDAYIEATAQHTFLGMAINGMDVDNDGDDDIVITAPGASDYATSGGCVFYIQGYSGFDLNIFNAQTLNTSLFTPSPLGVTADGAMICSHNQDAWFGWNAVPQFADIDNDGTMDLVVGSPVEEKVYIYFDIHSFNGVFNAETDADIIISGDRTFGYALETADLNGDGYMDILIGAPDINNPENMYYDANTIYDRGDNGNGGRIYIYSGANLSAGTNLTNNQADGRIGTSDDYFFGSDIVAGDMNGDGTKDIFVAEPMWQSQAGGDQEGAVYYFVSP